MANNFEEMLKEFKEYMEKIEYLNSAIGVLYWDMRTKIPKKGIPYRGEIIGYLSGESYKLQTSDKVKEFIDYFISQENLDDVAEAAVYKPAELIKKVTGEELNSKYFIDYLNKKYSEIYNLHCLSTPML